MRIALITDPWRADYPLSIRGPYYESQNHVTDNIAEAITGLGHIFKHLEAGQALQDALVRFNPNLIFNRSNCIDTETGVASTPYLLDRLRIPYTGPNPQSSVNACHKSLTKEILHQLKIPTPKYIVIHDPNCIEIPDDLTFPLFIKPIIGGCSLGIEGENLVYRKESCKTICSNLINNFKRPVIIEEFISGREFTVGILGNENPKILPLLEFVNLSQDTHFFRSFTSKMIVGKYEKKSCPAVIANRQGNQIKAMALKAYQGIGCRDYARIDIRLNKNNRPLILEVNAFPSLLSSGSSYGSMASAAGLSFEDLIRQILRIASKRYHLN